MPKALLEYMGYCIYFWIGDGEEPVHVHVSKKRQRQDATKFWVTSDSVELARDTGSVDACDMRDMLRYLRKIAKRFFLHGCGYSSERKSNDKQWE